MPKGMIKFFNNESALKILFVAPEAAPYVKVGGMGEVMYALPKWLNKLGYDTRIMMPLYAGIDQEKYKMDVVLEGLAIPTDSEGDESHPQHLICNVKKFTPGDATDEKIPVTSYFLENQEYYELRSNVYGYLDDAIRWALLSRGVLEFLRIYEEWTPDIIVAADWQTGFLPCYLRTVYRKDKKLSKITTIFTIHNLYYQGMFDHHFVSEMDYDDGKSSIPSFFSERLLKMNTMRRGIMNSDLITTVSPTYAKEIMTPEYGELLDGVLKERRSRVYGVLNGIDYGVFDPQTNPNLKMHYDANSFVEGKEANKLELQDRFGLTRNKDTFLVGIVSRLTEQKGFDLLFSVADSLIRELDMQFAVLGSGDAKYMGYFQDLENRFPGRVAAHLAFDRDLPHLVYAGADAILIPSKFEPSGLIQMEAMRYGAVPIARKTGGLADTVDDYDPKTGKGVGFVFKAFDSLALAMALVRASENYRNPRVWRAIEKRGMTRDFSWKQSALEYARLFKVALSLFKKRE